MEIVFQNKREDFEAFYDYIVRDTQQGKIINQQALRTQQLGYIISAITIGSISWALTGYWIALIISVIFLLVIWEAAFFVQASFKPRYYYGKRAYRQQEKFFTPKDIQVFSLPRKLSTDANWLEISNSEAVHRWRWRQVDKIGLTSDFIFIHVGNCPIVYIPKRDFSSEQSYISFGKMLVELKEKNENQPIGTEK